MRSVLAILIAITVLPVLCFSARAETQPLEIPARAYLLMDAASGRVLVEKNIHTKLPMASTTKIMTAILALERGNLSDVVTAGQKPYATGGTTMYLDLGEQQTLENLLYALMLESANDAAVAIAEHMAKTEEQFAAWMTEKAHEIGAVDTHYANSHGLHDPNHYTTAYDLAIMARYAMQNPQFRDLITTQEKVIPGFGKYPARQLYNHNRLLGYYEGANGVKNGYTEEAEFTNVASAKRGDTELIAVILGASDRIWTLSMELLDYGFQNFQTYVLLKKGEAVAEVQVVGAGTVSAVAADDVAMVLPVQGEPPKMRTTWEPNLKAPLAPGTRLGRTEISLNEREARTVDLVAPFGVLPAQGLRVQRRMKVSDLTMRAGLAAQDYLAARADSVPFLQTKLVKWAWPFLMGGGVLTFLWTSRHRLTLRRSGAARGGRREQPSGSSIAIGEIYLPVAAATATSPDGRKQVFFTVPQLEGMIRRVLALQPYTYRYHWTYDPQYQAHILFLEWPSGDTAGIAIPEGIGAWVLNYMLGTTDVYVTTEAVHDRLQERADYEEVHTVMVGDTVPLFDVQFQPGA